MFSDNLLANRHSTMEGNMEGKMMEIGPMDGTRMTTIKAIGAFLGVVVSILSAAVIISWN